MISAAKDGAGALAVTEARSSGAEAFRTLRTNLLFSRSVRSLRMVSVTSAMPSEGKTTTIANLAATFAQQGMRVLVADCDLRRPRLHEMFGCPREPGLTNVLVGQTPLNEAVRPTSLEFLSVLPAGTLPPNPAELLGGEHMRKLLETIRESYDIVLVDSPPVHAAADASIIGRLADGVLVVVRAGKTSRDAAEDAVRTLATVGSLVIGAVLNDPDDRVQAYGGYYYYSYYGPAAEQKGVQL
jgi:capsular exopolysaccharide synthesis family protein